MRSRPLALAAVTAAALVLPAAAAPAAEPTIQAGSAIVADGSYCTINWIYEGTGDQTGTVYAGTAAHCVEAVGQEVSLATTALGSTVQRIGQVAFLGDADVTGRDYAFVELDAAVLDQVDASLAGHPTIPTGVSTAAAPGDLIRFSGHGVGSHLTTETQQERVGVLNALDEREHQVLGVVTPGDSGGPVANLTEGGTALGIVNTVGVGVNGSALAIAHVGEGGNNLSFVLADAADRGFTVDLCAVGETCGD